MILVGIWGCLLSLSLLHLAEPSVANGLWYTFISEGLLCRAISPRLETFDDLHRGNE
jgi:hypothetical protein